MAGPVSFSKLVLIVDDDEGSLDLLELLVKNEGFLAQIAGDGATALEKVKTLKPDLLILDLMLPRYGGFEVLRRMQQDREASRIPIIVVSGRYTETTTVEIIRQEPNVKDVFAKPVPQEEFKAALHRILDSR